MKKKFTPPLLVVSALNIKQLVILFLSLIIYLPGYSASLGVKPVISSAVKTLAGEVVSSFTLMNADNESEIQTINSGSTINLNTLPTKNLNIRVNTTPATVGSVKMVLTGTQSNTKTETGAPYALFGDTNGNYNAWVPAVGSYTLTATPYSAASGGGTAGTAKTITFTFTNTVAQPTIQVNFQDPATIPPTGWVRDFGQPYGLRTGTNQGSNLTYGWKRRSDNTLLDLSVGGSTPGNGRNRNSILNPDINVLQATLMHMQADDVPGTFDGTKAEGYWEVKVPNGIYDVTVSAGDGGVYSIPESHSLNVEGAQAITKFIPTGAAGASTRFKSATVRVTVKDGNLTIDADGGTNTKINSASIVPVSSGPYTFWSVNEQLINAEKGSAAGSTFSLELSNSSNRSDVTYTVSATYGPGATGWLTFNATHTGAEPNVSFNYDKAKDLAIGTYQATVNAAAAGFATGSVNIRVTVSSPRPYVISSNPTNGATNVSVNTSSIAANNLFVPTVSGYPGGVDNSTITSNTVKLLKVVGTTTTQVAGVVQGTGGGDA
ncbi:MAG: hypothetical protein M3Q05_13170, partial [Bacteroidota bacterium]|nr:hypothetical protein [Bacteroidota bacterium]